MVSLGEKWLSDFIEYQVLFGQETRELRRKRIRGRKNSEAQRGDCTSKNRVLGIASRKNWHMGGFMEAGEHCTVSIGGQSYVLMLFILLGVAV